MIGIFPSHLKNTETILCSLAVQEQAIFCQLPLYTCDLFNINFFSYCPFLLPSYGYCSVTPHQHTHHPVFIKDLLCALNVASSPPESDKRKRIDLSIFIY